MSQQINLLPTAPRKRALPATSANAMLYGVLGVAALAALLAVYENYQLQTVQRRAQGVEGKLKEARQLHAKTLAEVKARKSDRRTTHNLRSSKRVQEPPGGRRDSQERCVGDDRPSFRSTCWRFGARA